MKHEGTANREFCLKAAYRRSIEYLTIEGVSLESGQANGPGSATVGALVPVVDGADEVDAEEQAVTATARRNAYDFMLCIWA